MTVRELELAQHGRDMGLDGLDREMESSRDFVVAVAASDQLQVSQGAAATAGSVDRTAVSS